MKIPSQSSAKGHREPLSVHTRGKEMVLFSATTAAAWALNWSVMCPRRKVVASACAEGESKAGPIPTTPSGSSAAPFFFFSRVLAWGGGGCMYTVGLGGFPSMSSPMTTRIISAAKSSALRSHRDRDRAGPPASAPLAGLAAGLGSPPFAAPSPSPPAAAGFSFPLRRAATLCTKALPSMDTPRCTSARFSGSMRQAVRAYSQASALRSRAARARAFRW
mmetsp:Transcript_3162/g.10449  ORF Transcript_3162/g.10449 Transcript_3162/m.10449 type:complete len:219 (+) Transcript_3162:681-1337(+)